MSAIEAIRSRRSIRGLTGPPLSAGEIEELVGLALLAPAPHHTTPWRFAQVLDGPARERLSDAMSAAWQRDMASDGVPAAQQTRALQRSRRRIVDAPTLLVGCIVGDGLNEYVDERRRSAEWTMAAHSFGAALQNVLLGAHERELGAYWISAPLYAQEAVRDSLQLDAAWRPQAAIALGRLRADYTPFTRPKPDIGRALVTRD